MSKYQFVYTMIKTLFLPKMLSLNKNVIKFARLLGRLAEQMQWKQGEKGSEN